ncbi:MAG: ribbon-helix-helix protein, CopG family [Candidatus Didemnitutus sp.]|nr:ribbon-helix-helix protein, CopG family [Candidatus Didemnitutus sp.]
MNEAPRDDNRPFAIQLEVEFLDRISEPVREGRIKSVSELIRRALERYDFTNAVVVRPAQVVTSVRLPQAVRRELKRVSRAKHTSVNQLVRGAIEAFLPQLEMETGAAATVSIPSIELPNVPEQPTRTKRRQRAQCTAAVPQQKKPARPTAKPAKAKPEKLGAGKTKQSAVGIAKARGPKNSLRKNSARPR